MGRSSQTRSATESPALVLVDVINLFDFPGGDKLLKNALPIAPRLARLKQRARRAGIPTFYVNDNFGQWRSNFPQLLEQCLRPEAPGRKFVEQLMPDDEDYLVLKPMHSAFYQTPLEVIFRKLGVRSMILGGLATNSCILCTVHDANMRDLKVYVPADCSAAAGRKEHTEALRQIEKICAADTSESRHLRML